MAALLLVLPAILGLLLPIAVLAENSNYMLSGETLGTDGRLVNEKKYDFVIQGDCNLVLYGVDGADWQSNTAGRGRNCVLKLDNHGQLAIYTGRGSIVWRSSSASGEGKYAAVLHPEGKVDVYGPAVWSTHSLLTVNINGRDVPLGNVPLVGNALFSGQVLYDDGSLTNGPYNFVMQGDCNFVLYGSDGADWQSNTHGNGKYCFLRLDHEGKLTIQDDSYNTVWSSKAKSTQGQYVFILQADGNAVVYGPVIWSTKTLYSSVAEAGIAMVTAEE